MSNPRANTPESVHATAIALGDKSVLIRGPSGSGKSDLALRCIAAAPLAHAADRAELVSDDQVILSRTAKGIETTAPPTIAGKIEVRGLGIVELPYRASACLALVVDIVPAEDVPRYPLDQLTAVFWDIEVPVVRLAAFEASAPVKLLLALNAAAVPLTPP
jgi:serine kinase of HPr protein (carbohydrate metabolism regulator)